jgi:pilus assembly protein Flp/PilA
MSNIALKALTQATVYVGTWAKTTTTHLKHRGDRGQGAVEYVGIIILVGVIIAAVVGSGAGAAIANGLVTQVTRIVGGGG